MDWSSGSEGVKVDGGRRRGNAHAQYTAGGGPSQPLENGDLEEQEVDWEILFCEGGRWIELARSLIQWRALLLNFLFCFQGLYLSFV
jgi:hypothetical protein